MLQPKLQLESLPVQIEVHSASSTVIWMICCLLVSGVKKKQNEVTAGGNETE